MTFVRRPLAWVLVLVAMACAAFIFLVAPNYKLYLIHTGSMTPTIPIGSAVLVRKGQVHVGEVITFRPLNGGAVVTHRLVGINANGTLITKGDGNKTPDVDIVTRANVVGPVVAAPRSLGTWINFAFHTKSGAVFDGLFLFILAILLSNPKKTDERQGGSHRVGPHGRRGSAGGGVDGAAAADHVSQAVLR